MPSAYQKAIASATGAIVAICALITSAPGLAWLDAGDFVTASSTLGVPHPTGFPVFTLIGHLSTYIPFGNHASRVAIPSAVFSGLTALCLMAMIGGHTRRLSEMLGSALAVILVFFCSPTLFMHSRVPEVYALNVALAAGCLLCIERSFATDDRRWCHALAILLGLGLANHALFRLWTPFFALALLGNPTLRKVRILVPWLALLLFAALSYLYLPVAAARGPLHNWGDPSTLTRFVDHITAASIRAAFKAEMSPSFFSLQVHIRTYLEQLWSSLGPLLLFGVAALCACFLSVLKRNGKQKPPLLKTGIVAGCLIVTELAYATAINPMGLRDFQNGQMSIALLAAASGLFIVRSICTLAERIALPRRIFTAFSVLLVPIASISFMDHDFFGIGRDWGAEDLAVIHTSFAQPEAMTILVSDSLIASHLYTNTVQDARPDMAIFGRNQLTYGRRFAYMARKQPYPLLDDVTLEEWKSSSILTDVEFRQRIGAILSRHIDVRRVYWEPFSRGKDLPPNFVAQPGWPLGTVEKTRNARKTIPCEPFERSFCGTVADVVFAQKARSLSGSRGIFYRHWLANQWGAVGARLFKEGRFSITTAMYAKIAEIAPDRPVWMTNLAVSLASTGRVKEALSIIEQVLERDPLSTVALKNGLLYAKGIGDQETLARLMSHARRLNLVTNR
ncbi:MAG: DUF2723 domain-containing protein [Deltaproteobacteria bacterium]|nr:DUF2723 domain-containing protein [Deltaproteobacteria bacterium]